jgi:hypothetical protein
MATEYQGWSEWADKFKPKTNHFGNNENDRMYETYGEEWEYIKSLDPKYVWTFLSGDMCDVMVAGIAFVNRLGYYVCEVPWEDDMDSVLLSVEEECECYNEDGYDDNDGEYGKRGCENCEGCGYVTNYV